MCRGGEEGKRRGREKREKPSLYSKFCGRQKTGMVFLGYSDRWHRWVKEEPSSIK